MPKLTTSDLTSLTNETSAVTTINNNFAAVETAMENTLSRDGTTPNTMSADIDLNGNDLLNIGTYSFSGSGTLAATVGYAEEWANKAEDSLVTVAAGGNGTTEYSALHWAAKAADDAIATAADVVSTNADVVSTNADAVSTAADVVSAAASAASAASVLEDIIFNDVVYLTSASSPYTLLTTQTGVLLAIDTSGGAVTVNLPSIASAGDGWRISAKKTTGDANFVTFARNGTDTIDGNTSDTITTVGQSKTYVADTDGTPDDWTSVNFGSTLGRTWTDFTYTASGGETSVTGADDDGVVLAYQAGQVKVYLEGLLLDDSDYTATNGTSITGLAALLVGQTLYIETWDNVMSLGTMAAQDANAVAITGGTLAGITSINAVTPATAQYTTALDTKLNGIEALADVTDATNVTAAGALMDSELTSIASVKALNQGVATTDTPTFAGIITSGNVDGRDVSVDGTKLDGIEAAADVTDSTNVLASLVGQEVVATGFTGTLDGVLGGGTPAAAAVTTLTASGEIAGTSGVAISGGTANTSVDIALPNTNFLAWYDAAATGATTAYIQGSGGAITVNGSSLTFSGGNSDFLANNITTTGTLSAGATDVTTLTASGNAAINTTLPTINTVDGALLVGSQGSIMCFSNEVDVGHNFYYNSGWKYRTTDTASQLTMGNSGVPFLFQYTASGTADTAITWSEAGRIDASGNWNFQAKSLTTTGTLSAGATDVTTGSAGTWSASANYDDLIVESSGAGGVSLAVPDASEGIIAISSPSTTGSLGIGLLWKYDTGVGRLFTGKVGATLALEGDNQVPNLTLSGASGSELATFAKTVNVAGSIDGATTGSAQLICDETATATNPTLIPYKSAVTTGVGGTATTVSLISSGVEGLTVSGGATPLATFAGDVNVGDHTQILVDDDLKFIAPSSATGTQDQRIAWWNETEAGIMAMIAVDRTAGTLAPADMVFYTSANVDTAANGGEGDRAEVLRLVSDGSATFAGTADITNGVYIGGSVAANLLDDYEEGTWTPVLSSATTTTYTTQIGYYTKIGNVVTVNCAFQINSLGDGSTTQLTGLPFTFFGSSSHQGAVGYFTGLATNVLSLGFYGNAGATTVNFMTTNTAGTGATLNPAIFGDGARVQFTMTYTV
jgi:hypothetical protein